MRQIKLVDGEKVYSFDLIAGNKNDVGIDLRLLHEKTGLFSYDSGLRSTAICRSGISYIDETKGKLFYRGHIISELVDKYDFLSVAYLLIYGKFPTEKAQQDFQGEINLDYSSLSALLPSNRFPENIIPIDALKICLSLLIANKSDKKYNETIPAILSYMPMIIAHIANKQKNKEIFIKGDYVETFLCNYFNKQEVSATTIRLIQKFLILHMDHEQNASTTAVRIIGATGNSPLNSIFSGILALEGSRHGGANEQVINMLKNIDSYKDMLRLIENAKNNKECIFGLGHRVYRTIDPRAIILKNLCREYFSDNPLLQKAQQLEHLVTHEEYFIERKLYPNLDFYSGILLQGLGIETKMFLLFFVLARTVGWLSHWKEMNENKGSLIRPRQIYIGD